MLLDIGVLVVVAGFAVWGAFRGWLCGVVHVGLLVAALFVAPRLGPSLDSTLVKVTSLGPAERDAAAWAAVLFATLLVGGLLLSFFGARIRAHRASGRLDRSFGAVLGLAKAIVVLLVLGYVVLGYAGPGPDGAPSLRRDVAPPTAGERTLPTESPRWVLDARSTQAARWLTRLGAAARRIVPLPVWIEAWMHGVEDAVEVAHAPR